MGTFEVDTIINAPLDAVWKRLAGDIGTIAEWSPGVIESYVMEGSRSTGIGAQRHCNLGKNYLEEIVIHYVHQEAITFQITDTDLPFTRADIHFVLEPITSGPIATRVTCSPDYKLKYGCIGEILDWCMVQSTYRKGMDNLLAGLQKDVETTEAIEFCFR